jgi:hypothetical protein
MVMAYYLLPQAFGKLARAKTRDDAPKRAPAAAAKKFVLPKLLLN